MDDLSSYDIRKLHAADELPVGLLLLADETMEAVEKYIHDSEVYVAYVGNDPTPIAVFVLYQVSKEEVEIKNIAVDEEHQGLGIGSLLLKKIVQLAKDSGYRYLLVGTSGVRFRQIKFYQQNGFEKFGIRKNFFTENYPEPIVENRQVLTDMALFRLALSRW